MQNIKPFYKRPPEEEYFCNGQDKTDEFVQELTKNSHNMQKIYKIYLSRNKITHLGVLYFSSCNWDQLALLSLISNRIGNKGCKYISRVSFKNIQLLALDDNQIDWSGLLHLSKPVWTMDEGLTLSSNKIGTGSSSWINRGRWRTTKLQLQKNQLNAQEVKQLLLSERGEDVYFFLGKYFEGGNMNNSQTLATKNALRAFFRRKSQKFLYDF